MTTNWPPGEGEETPDSPRAKIRRATEAIVAVRRHFGDDDAVIREGVVGDIKEALEGDEPWVKLIPLAGVPEPEPCASLPGIYRMVLDHYGLDRCDLHLQESVFEWVRRALDEALELAGGDAGPRSD